MPRVWMVEDLAPPGLVGHADDDLAVEPAGAAQRLVERFGPVGGGDDDEVLPRFDPVHQRQQLRDQPFLGLAADLAALGRDRVDLVDEDDRRRRLGRFLEDVAQALFGFAIGRAHDFGPRDVEELRVALIGDRLGQPGLAGARAGRGAARPWAGRPPAAGTVRGGAAAIRPSRAARRSCRASRRGRHR